MTGHVRLVLPHQLFETHLDAPAGTAFVLVEHDLLFRQYRFHTQKLVLHRASMRRFADRLRGRGFDVVQLDTDGRTTSRAALAREIKRLHPQRVTVYDVVDDWLSLDLTAALDDGGYELTADDVLESPNFLTTRAQLRDFFDGGTPRMQHFYAWQRARLDVLMTSSGKPEGGRWSYDEDNRKKLPPGHAVPDPQRPDPADRDPHVAEAVDWVRRAFPDNPGRAETFAWPTSHAEAGASYERFLAERFAEFGPFEDALSPSTRSSSTPC